MREILFRGKTEDGSRWVYGMPCATEQSGIYAIQTLQGGIFDTLPETIGQYTGLTDKNGKNGKKIFEGDCWLDTDDDYIVYVVEFRDGQFGFACYGWRGALMPYGFDEDAGGWGEIEFEPMTNFIIENIEIIGNIHDNPELLKGEQE